MKENKNIRFKTLENFLKKTFFASLIFRFCYCIYYNPIHQLWSDPMRHWNNGVEFFKFTYNSGMDPKLYQLYLSILRFFLKDDPILISMATGFLAVGVAYIWYLVAKELFFEQPKKAYVFGIIFSLLPSLLAIFGYFFNETLLVFVIGVATYLTLKTYKQPTKKDFIYASIFWGLASITKITALPMGVIAIFFILRKFNEKIILASTSFAIIGFFISLACIQTYKSANIFSPAYTMPMNKIYNKSGYQTIQYEVTNGNWTYSYVWSSGSFYMDFLSPLRKYETHRRVGTYHFKIDTRNGADDWNNEIEKLSKAQNIKDKILNYYENFIIFTMAGSWPDMGNASFLTKINYSMRFIWLPIVLMVVLFAFAIRTDSKQIYIIINSFAMILLFIIQDTGIMEARYRKAIEPYLIFSVYIIFAALFNKNKNENDETFYSYCINSAKEWLSPFVKYKKTSGDDKTEADSVVPI